MWYLCPIQHEFIGYTVQSTYSGILLTTHKTVKEVLRNALKHKLVLVFKSLHLVRVIRERSYDIKSHMFIFLVLWPEAKLW